jgi:hypothetical protein
LFADENDQNEYPSCGSAIKLLINSFGKMIRINSLNYFYNKYYLLTPPFTTWLGIPIFGSNFWDPHCKWNSNSVFDSEDSGRKIFFEFRCLESQKVGIPIPKFGIPVPHKKTDAYSSIDTKVQGRKPSP